jgi:hypothetical protein
VTSVERDRDSQPDKVIEIRSHGVSDSIKSQESSKSDVSSLNLIPASGSSNKSLDPRSSSPSYSSVQPDFFSDGRLQRLERHTPHH